MLGVTKESGCKMESGEMTLGRGQGQEIKHLAYC
jgi:hypothetical protein